jgi:hypothetical protein
MAIKRKPTKKSPAAINSGRASQKKEANNRG